MTHYNENPWLHKIRKTFILRYILYTIVSVIYIIYCINTVNYIILWNVFFSVINIVVYMHYIATDFYPEDF